MFRKLLVLGAAIVVAVILSSCSISGGNTPEQERAVNLFTDVQPDSSQLSSQSAQQLGALRAQETASAVRLVRVQLDALRDGNPVNFNVSDGEGAVLAMERRDDRASDDFSWQAQDLDNQTLATLVSMDGQLVGTVRIRGQLYQVKPLGNDLHAIITVDEDRFVDHPAGYDELEDAHQHQHQDEDEEPVEMPELHDLAELITLEDDQEPVPGTLQLLDLLDEDLDPAFEQLDEAATRALFGEGDSSITTQDSGLVIRVLVAYTPQASSAAGNINALIQLAIDETNLSYLNSGIEARLQLVYKYQTAYVESGNLKTDRNRFRIAGDGIMDEVHGLRNQVGADVAILITGSGSGCGIAADIMANANTAFAVVKESCATGYYTFGHEIGHLQGARHNPQADPNIFPFVYGHGYYNQVANWRTIMSYNCPGGCTRLPYWSNPHRTYGGNTMGSSTQHNARVLNDTALTVANFRTGGTSDSIWWGQANKSFQGTSTSVVGTYQPISGDFNGDGEGDIFWYRAGSATDYIWWGRTNKTFQSTSTNVYGSYRPVSGDFNGDGRDDIFWYRAGSGSDYIWWGNANKTFSSTSKNVYGTYEPFTGDFNGDGEDDIFWYRPGSATDYIWWGKTNKTFSSSSLNVSGSYQPISGDFNGDGRSDVFWYRLGSGSDYIWWGNANKTFSGSSTNVYGTYRPIGGDFNGDGESDIFWYRPGSATDFIWWGRPNKTFQGSSTNVYGDYRPISGDFNGDGEDDIFWYRRG